MVLFVGENRLTTGLGRASDGAVVGLAAQMLPNEEIVAYLKK